MKERVLGLIGLTLAGLVSLLVCAYWTHVLSQATTPLVRENAEYKAVVWLGAFVIFAAFWIWLLVKIIRRNRSEHYS